jgi:putative transposase
MQSAERFVRSIKESCLDRLILFGEAGLRKAIQNFIVHYHAERNHQGKGNRGHNSLGEPGAQGRGPKTASLIASGVG